METSELVDPVQRHKRREHSNPEREVDTSSLSVDATEQSGQIHRDYIAHSLRWSAALRLAMKMASASPTKHIRVLDVGCGQHLPLFRALKASTSAKSVSYVGVDVRKSYSRKVESAIPKKSSREFSLYFDLPIQDFTADNQTTPSRSSVQTFAGKDASTPFELVTCFEVVEHISPAEVGPMLTRIHELLCPRNGVAMISTPAWNLKAAAVNHINEMTYEAFGACLEANGFHIAQHYGTFASQTDIKKEMTEAELDIFNRLKAYYDTNVLSIIFAPLYPQASRNVVWYVYPRRGGEARRFPILRDIAHPWSQHPNYRDLDNGYDGSV